MIAATHAIIIPVSAPFVFESTFCGGRPSIGNKTKEIIISLVTYDKYCQMKRDVSIPYKHY